MLKAMCLAWIKVKTVKRKDSLRLGVLNSHRIRSHDITQSKVYGVFYSTDFTKPDNR